MVMRAGVVAALIGVGMLLSLAAPTVAQRQDPFESAPGPVMEHNLPAAARPHAAPSRPSAIERETRSFRPPEPAAPPDPELSFWQRIAASSNPADFDTYLRVYPNGRYAAVAQQRVLSLRPPNRWDGIWVGTYSCVAHGQLPA